MLPITNSFWQKVLPVTNINANLPDSYIFAYDIESPVGAKLPLWMLGFFVLVMSLFYRLQIRPNGATIVNFLKRRTTIYEKDHFLSFFTLMREFDLTVTVSNLESFHCIRISVNGAFMKRYS